MRRQSGGELARGSLANLDDALQRARWRPQVALTVPATLAGSSAVYSGGLAVDHDAGMAVGDEWIPEPYTHVIHRWDTATWQFSTFYRTTDNFRFSGLAFHNEERSESRRSARPRRVSRCLRVSHSRRDGTR